MSLNLQITSRDGESVRNSGEITVYRIMTFSQQKMERRHACHWHWLAFSYLAHWYKESQVEFIISFIKCRERINQRMTNPSSIYIFSYRNVSLKFLYDWTSAGTTVPSTFSVHKIEEIKYCGVGTFKN